MALFSIWKVVFFGYLNIEGFVLVLGYFIVIALITIAIVRRFGPLNYLEAFLMMFIWFVVGIFVDIVVVVSLVSTDLYTNWLFWATQPAVLLTIFRFHKKLHVEARKALQ